MHRLRLATVCVVLSAFMFIQDPGRIAADTKLDLAVNPSGFLSRALTLWEPTGFFGQLQNQAYGYLFPTGPFFALGDALGLPAWIVQRLWWSTVAVVAFLGAVRLARLLGVTHGGARILGGLAYAVSPRMLSEIGVLTVEVLPYAMAPWVVIPLASAALGTITLRRGAALSGLAVLCAGGVNAVATAAVVPLGAIWIITRFRGGQRWRIGGWWCLSLALATLWWAIPLLILGRYSPPFLDWIESASVTTLFTRPEVVVRGASNWVAYVLEPGGPTWPTGWAVATEWPLILASGVVAAVGLTGLALRGTPHRGFLVGSLLVGLVLVSLGHTGTVQGLGASAIQDLLDGVLAPLRNTHKFDLVVRLPIAIGVGFALQAAIGRVRRSRPDAPRLVLAAMVGVLMVGSWPLLTGALVRERSFEGIPGYWTEATQWLARESPDGRALLVPGASFGIYNWGRTQDEPLQPLAQSPWAVRDAVPLSSAGNIRWLDGIQDRLDSGLGSPGLATSLSRAGVEYVVMRNDVDQRRSATPAPAILRQALMRSGGFAKVAEFGPVIAVPRTNETILDDGLQDRMRAVEVWRVTSPIAPRSPRVALRDATRVRVIDGAAESLIDLADTGLIDARPVVISGDEGPIEELSGVTLERIVTDTFRRVEVGFGSTRNQRSQTLTQGEAFIQDRRVHDYVDGDTSNRRVVAVFGGVQARASSSGSEATAVRSRAPAAQPWAALDGDPATAWRSGQLTTAVGEWWEVVASRPGDVAWIDVRWWLPDDPDAQPLFVRVTTDAGSAITLVETTEDWQRIPVAPGPTTTVRIGLEAVTGEGPGDAFGLREVVIPGWSSDRWLDVPASESSSVFVFTARKGTRAPCIRVSGLRQCSPHLERLGEEHTGVSRVIRVASPGAYRVTMWVRPRPGVALDQLLSADADTRVTAEASGSRTDAPAHRAQSAVDGLRATAWVASPRDRQPELVIELPEPRLVRGVRLHTASRLAASRPLVVTAIMNGREHRGLVSADGTLLLPPTETSRILLRFVSVEPVRNVDPRSGLEEVLPVGITEVSIVGAEDVDRGPDFREVIEVPCGQGPALRVDGSVAMRTSVSTTVGSATDGMAVQVSPCEGRTIDLPAGVHRIDVESTPEFIVEAVALDRAWVNPVTVEGHAAVESWGAAERSLRMARSDSVRILETTENANDGWQASVDGSHLKPIRVDGWRQGWIVPAGVSGTVRMHFAPQSAYVGGLLAGGLCAIVLVCLALLGPQRRTLDVPEAQRGSWLRLAGLGLVACVLVGGLPGAVAWLFALVLGVFSPRPWNAGALALLATLGAVLAPWGSLSDASAWLVTCASLAAVAAVATVALPAGPWWRRAPMPGPGVRGDTTMRWRPPRMR